MKKNFVNIYYNNVLYQYSSGPFKEEVQNISF